MFDFLNRKLKATNPKKVDNSLPALSTSQTGRTSAGVTVTEDQAMTLDSVFACVRVLSESIAALPLNLMRESALGGATVAKDHPLHRILKVKPNGEMTSYEFRLWLIQDALIRGTGYAHILRDSDGNVTELWPLLARNVKPIRSEDGELFFGYNDAIIPDSDILRIQVLPHGGVIGKSIIAMQASALGITKASEDFAGEYFANSAAPSLVMNVPGDFTLQQFDRLKNSLRQYQSGSGNRHNALVVEKDVSVTPMAINASEAQILESRKYSRSVIASLFRVPPHLIGDLEKASFSSLEQQDLAFIKHCLSPWLVNFEQRLGITLLSEEEQLTHFFKFNLNALAKGDMNSRYTAYSQAINSGIMSPNECRALEDMPAYEGGDIKLVQGALRDIKTPA